MRVARTGTSSRSTLVGSNLTLARTICSVEPLYISSRNGSMRGPNSSTILADHLAKSLVPCSMLCEPTIMKSFNISGSRPDLNVAPLNAAFNLFLALSISNIFSKKPSPFLGFPVKSSAVLTGKKSNSSGSIDLGIPTPPLPPGAVGGLLTGTDPWNPSPKSLVTMPPLTTSPLGLTTCCS